MSHVTTQRTYAERTAYLAGALNTIASVERGFTGIPLVPYNTLRRRLSAALGALRAQVTLAVDVLADEMDHHPESTPDTVTPEVRAVLDAARAWAGPQRLLLAIDLTLTSPSRTLLDAVNALDGVRTP